jgi:hypothetical protein
MKSIIFGLVILFTLISAPICAHEIRQVRLQLKPGAIGTTIKDSIKGYQSVDYQFYAGAGQSIVVNFKTNNLSAYFNVMPPGTNEAIFIGSTSGNRFEDVLPADGVYTIRVYLMRNAARRHETANYTLEAGIVEDGTAVSASIAGPVTRLSFDRTLELQGIRFHVTCSNGGSINTLRIVPKGLTIDNTPIVRSIEGTVTGAEAADLNVDGSPEIYVYVTSAGSGSHGSLVAYSANRLKSLSEIYLPPVTQDKKASIGYAGHDEFAVVENVLVQRFPVYRDSDTNAKATGGMRQLQYKLIPGEAGWVLKLDRMVEY